MKLNIHLLKANQKDITISYDYVNSPFGVALLMCAEGKICYLGFVDENYYNRDQVFEIAKKSFKKLNATFISADLSTIVEGVFSQSLNDVFPATPQKPLDILLIGTTFQINVWKALLSVNSGEVISYEELSKRVEGCDKSRNYTRASSTAVANNKISLIVPCHRIIRKSGSINKYLWGIEVKRKILKHEGNSF